MHRTCPFQERQCLIFLHGFPRRIEKAGWCKDYADFAAITVRRVVAVESADRVLHEEKDKHRKNQEGAASAKPDKLRIGTDMSKMQQEFSEFACAKPIQVSPEERLQQRVLARPL